MSSRAPIATRAEHRQAQLHHLVIPCDHFPRRTRFAAIEKMTFSTGSNLSRASLLPMVLLGTTRPLVYSTFEASYGNVF